MTINGPDGVNGVTPRQYSPVENQNPQNPDVARVPIGGAK